MNEFFRRRLIGFICRVRGQHTYVLKTFPPEAGLPDGQICRYCGKVQVSRAQLLRVLLPALNELFGLEYKQYKKYKEKT